MVETSKPSENKSAVSPEFRMQKMYIKDLSFENPNAPEIFLLPQKSEPKVEVNLQLNNKKVSEDHWKYPLGLLQKLLLRGRSQRRSCS
jgi:preprotein translocase subunit SecB